MESKRKTIIKLLTYTVFFVLVGLSLGASASEFTVVDALNTSLLSTENAQSEASFSSFWLLIAGLLSFIAMTQRKSI